MQHTLIVSTVCFVILSNCLLYEARSLFVMDPGVLLKRNVERRSFIKSFCARRCNIGKGGNVCRCNGFHFAGKRTSNPPLESEQLYNDDDAYDENMLYKILEENDKIRLQHGRPETNISEEMILAQIEELLPQVMAEEARYILSVIYVQTLSTP